MADTQTQQLPDPPPEEVTPATQVQVAPPPFSVPSDLGSMTYPIGRPTPPPVLGPLPPVPGYRVTGEIGRGGMGRVLAAWDPAFGREVAVKLLLPGRVSADAARRFVREATVTGRLTHPGIPPAYRLGVLADGGPFLVMKYVRGRTLAALLGERPDPTADRPRFVAVFERIAQAVGFAHTRGVVHRDLKPANVMVGEFGEVQVMDWGLAKVLAEPDDDAAAATDTRSKAVCTLIPPAAGELDGHTRAGAVMGTPAYMAPEQARGAIDRIDPRTDVFGLGGILAMILTGQPPFLAESGDTAAGMAASGDVADCFARLSGCGADLELLALCRRCLAADPADRPADGGEVAAVVAALRAAADERARQAELDRVKAEADRAAAVAQAAEQRRRRAQAVAGRADVHRPGRAGHRRGVVEGRRVAAGRRAGIRPAGGGGERRVRPGHHPGPVGGCSGRVRLGAGAGGGRPAGRPRPGARAAGRSRPRPAEPQAAGRPAGHPGRHG